VASPSLRNEFGSDDVTRGSQSLVVNGRLSCGITINESRSNIEKITAFGRYRTIERDPALVLVTLQGK